MLSVVNYDGDTVCGIMKCLRCGFKLHVVYIL
jgi:hypothetical protein